MVKKLFKHEVKAYLRILLIVWAGLLGIATLSRIVQFFEQDSVVYRIVNYSSLVVYAVGLAVCVIFPFIYAIVRFYKNLFTGEGYLTFTLPVTTFSHIWVKLSAALSMQLSTLLVVLLSGMIITSGDMLTEIFKAAQYFLTRIHLLDAEFAMHLPAYVAEYALLLIIAEATGLLLYYACISIGQLSRKNRILMAVVVYFGHYFLCQVLQTVAIIVFALIGNWEEIIEPVLTFMEKHYFAAVHIFIWGFCIILAAIGALYFAISNTIIRKKLNLE